MTGIYFNMVLTGVNQTPKLTGTQPEDGHLPLGFKGDFIANISQALLKKGEWKSPEGKMIVIFSDRLNTVRINDLNNPGIVKRSQAIGSATTLLGKIGPSGDFIVGTKNTTRENRAFVVIVDKNKYASDIPALQGAVAHEMRHGADHLVGYRNILLNEINDIVKTDSKKDLALMSVFHASLGELSAYYCQLDHFLANANKMPKATLAGHLRETVIAINMHYGLINYIYKEHGPMPGYGNEEFNRRLKAIEEQAIPFEVVVLYSNALRPYNMGVDPKSKNPPQLNEILMKEAFTTPK
jgi:hypothetical protein